MNDIIHTGINQLWNKLSGNLLAFRDGDNFCKAFTEAQVHISHITSGEATSDMTEKLKILSNHWVLILKKLVKSQSGHAEIFLEFFYVSFPKKYHTWIQQFYFGRKQKYIWKHFYSIKRPVSNRAIVAYFFTV